MTPERIHWTFWTLLAALAWALSHGCVCPTAGADRGACAHAGDRALRWLRFDISSEEAAAQAREFAGDVGFPEALRAAQRALAEDARDPESLAALGASGAARSLGRGARLRLAGRRRVPPGGERVAKAWLFYAVVPALSDHVFWAVVGRRRNQDGRVVAYTYGAN